MGISVRSPFPHRPRGWSMWMREIDSFEWGLAILEETRREVWLKIPPLKPPRGEGFQRKSHTQRGIDFGLILIVFGLCLDRIHD